MATITVLDHLLTLDDEVCNSCVIFTGETEKPISDQLRMEETKVMDVLCIPSCQHTLRQPWVLGLS